MAGYPSIKIRINIIVFSFILLFGFSLKAQPSASNYSFHDLHFDSLASRWDEALPLGNGMLGLLLWEKEGKLRFSLDRADLWDLRSVDEMDNLTFQWVKEQLMKDTYDTVRQLVETPYRDNAYPTKIPAAALEFNIDALGEVEYAHLYLENALAEVKWKNGAILRTFIHATDPLGWFRFENLPSEITPELIIPNYYVHEDAEGVQTVSGHGLGKLGYEAGEVEKNANKVIYTQPGAEGMSYQVAMTWENQEKICEGIWSISAHYPDQKQDFASDRINKVSKKGFDDFISTHTQWWDQYWAQSIVQIPDSIIEKQYYLDMYKFGAVTRKGTPAITLQGVWTADNGSLPPWKGDFHHDLNTQLSYWPGYSGNHLQLTESFTDWLWEVREENKRYTKQYFQTDGLNVPGVSSLNGEPMGGWAQYSLSPTVSAWLAQHFYWQWKYSKDEKFLKEKAYPYLHDVAIYLDEITSIEEGARKLPLSSSPEIHDNKTDAWFQDFTNYDLALTKYAFQIAAEAAAAVGEVEEEKRWMNCVASLPELSTDESGLLIAPGLQLEDSHRHFSHLMGIHPLGLLDPANGKEDSEIIENSLKHLDEKGTRLWTGYSFSWLSNLYARAGNGEKAAEALRIFATNFVSTNSFHLNGDQKGGEYSNFKYRPFTLEGNFAYPAGLHEMLMQSNTGIIEIFPAIPNDWTDVSFTNLRAIGAFLVSAEKQRGKLQEVTIRSEKGGELQVENPFPGNKVTVQLKKAGETDYQETSVKKEKNILILSTSAGDEIMLRP